MALDLQVILDAATGGGQNTTAERVAAVKAAAQAEGVTRDDLEALVNEAVEKFGALNSSDDLDADGINGLELLGEVIETVRGVQTGMEEAAAQARAKRDELASRVLGQPADDGGDPSAPDGNGEPEQVESTEPAETAAPEPVAASARRRFDLGSIKPQAAVTPTTPAPGVAITAAAGLRGVEAGASMDLDALVAAAQARLAAMPMGTDGYVKSGVAQIRVEFPDGLIASGIGDEAGVLEHAADQSRLDGGAITASGGWCAPSERLYDVISNLADPNAGLVDVPEIQVKRGGIEFTEGAKYSTVWAGNAGLVQTETQAIANTTKVLYRPTCPTFADVRADVVYSGLIVGFLQNDAYPEVTKDTLANLMAVHAHRVNKLTLEKLAAASTGVNLTTLGPSATGSILNGIGLSIMDARYRERAAEGTIFDVILPIWVKEAVRADYALRGGIELNQVSDEQITSWITARGGRPQWVYDWQDAYTNADSSGFGGATALTAYPTTVKALVYPTGTFVRGRGDVVNLDTVYDSAMTEKNDYLQMFMEEKHLVAKRAHSSLQVTLALGINGTVGAAQVLDGNGKIVPAVTP